VACFPKDSSLDTLVKLSTKRVVPVDLHRKYTGSNVGLMFVESMSIVMSSPNPEAAATWSEMEGAMAVLEMTCPDLLATSFGVAAVV
jgi:hypothetical protein